MQLMYGSENDTLMTPVPANNKACLKSNTLFHLDKVHFHIKHRFFHMFFNL